MRRILSPNWRPRVIVSVLGGSSQSTPVLLNWLAEQTNPGHYIIRLGGRDRQRLAAVERACKIVAPGIHVAGFERADWPECISGSTLVLIQVRIGGYQGRQKDEQLACEIWHSGG
jgi:alpha-galactosidase/6-phospho-beta-glucosidase family protein